MMTFIESPAFTRQILEMLDDDEYRSFQNHLAENPAAGDVIPGLFGLRKVRVALPGRGKSGGARVIYLALVTQEAVHLLYAYSKGDVSDLAPEQKKRLQVAVAGIKREYSQ